MNEVEVKALEKGLEDAKLLDFELKNGEGWSTYRIEDGSIIKIKTLLTGVARIDGKRDQFGRPTYLLNTQNIVRLVSCKKELIKKPNKAGIT